jgi:uncharacterized C2H2 Zn-finger protein
MELFDTLFEYLRESRIGICKAHCYGVLLSQLPTHLQRSHKELSVAARKAVVLAASEYPAWATSAEAVVVPAPASHPVAHLPVYRDGLKCCAETQARNQCGHIVRTLRDMQEHCRKEHGWTNPRKRGRPYETDQAGGNHLWVEGVWCQKFQPGRQLARLFEVSPPRSEGTQEEGREDSDVQRALEAS